MARAAAPPRRVTRSQSREPAKNGTSPVKGAHPAGKRATGKTAAGKTAAGNTAAGKTTTGKTTTGLNTVAEESPRKSRQKGTATSLVTESPENHEGHTNLSGTTFLTDAHSRRDGHWNPHEEAKLQTLIMLDEFPGLHEATDRILGLYKAHGADPKPILTIAKRHADPTTTENRRLAPAIKRLLAQMETFTERQFIRPFDISTKIEPVPATRHFGEWNPMPLVYRANCARLALFVFNATKNPVSRGNIVRELEEEHFPQPFLQSIVKDTESLPTPGEQLISSKDEKGFDAVQCLLETFYNKEALEDAIKENGSPDPDSAPPPASLRGFPVEGLSDEMGLLPEAFHVTVTDHVLELQEAIVNEDDEVDPKALQAAFSWNRLQMRTARFLWSREQELRHQVEMLPEVDDVREYIETRADDGDLSFWEAENSDQQKSKSPHPETESQQRSEQVLPSTERDEGDTPSPLLPGTSTEGAEAQIPQSSAAVVKGTPNRQNTQYSAAAVQGTPARQTSQLSTPVGRRTPACQTKQIQRTPEHPASVGQRNSASQKKQSTSKSELNKKPSKRSSEKTMATHMDLMKKRREARRQREAVNATPQTARRSSAAEDGDFPSVGTLIRDAAATRNARSPMEVAQTPEPEQGHRVMDADSTLLGDGDDLDLTNPHENDLMQSNSPPGSERTRQVSYNQGRFFGSPQKSQTSGPQKQKQSTPRRTLLDPQNTRSRVIWTDDEDSPHAEEHQPPPSRSTQATRKRRRSVADDDSDDDFDQDDRELDIQSCRAHKPSKRKRVSSEDGDPGNQLRGDLMASSQPAQTQEQENSTPPTSTQLESPQPTPSQTAIARINAIDPPPSQSRWSQLGPFDTAAPRKRWSANEEERLVDLVTRSGPRWADIKRIDAVCPRSDGGPLLTHRTQVQLKDKARNIKKKYIREGRPLPKNFDQITC
ncbi:hypothetical protein N7532_001611 [Penicillium argentinense]|uniref:Myb-like domain-containing protein n=1 Tax=Penicillium argentinense TaxID=1131581 RepID=A0A9W9KML5_9EURO|nr:uncharacterized protein N7532_001611 [Penicillium argentinense]KAJ5111076.1 hypothetical protein N7532_001611 [Penicillium argentinense]